MLNLNLDYLAATQAYTYKQVLAAVIEVISDVTGNTRVTESTRLSDLNLDSLDKTEIAVNIEEKFGVTQTIPDSVYEKIPETATVKELALYVTNLLNHR